jgi:hypothetical protein
MSRTTLFVLVESQHCLCHENFKRGTTLAASQRERASSSCRLIVYKAVSINMNSFKKERAGL